MKADQSSILRSLCEPCLQCHARQFEPLERTEKSRLNKIGELQGDILFQQVDSDSS